MGMKLGDQSGIEPVRRETQGCHAASPSRMGSAGFARKPLASLLACSLLACLASACPQFPDYSSWMKDQGSQTLKALHLPGTHDSSTYGFASGVQYPTLALQWAKAQDCNITQQLTAGIRFLDLRVSWNSIESHVVLSHSFQASPLDAVLQQIADFVGAYPSEVVVVYMTGDTLDFKLQKALQAMSMPQAGSTQHWDSASKSIARFFGARLIKAADLDFSLSVLTAAQRNVLIISDELAQQAGFVAVKPAHINYLDSWAGDSARGIPATQTDGSDADQLIPRINKFMAAVDGRELYTVIKAQVTPGIADIIAGGDQSAGLVQWASVTNTSLLSDALSCRSNMHCSSFRVLAMDFPTPQLVEAVLSMNAGGTEPPQETQGATVAAAG
ncbi:hypothetical protein WJX72_008937 [[Myrmecia] bisecta]|uniref:Phosphatidylinositol-specific phospholipase C X domain-containing protein n=1 Tax=[Myrmecia] bisecta TaxID=41462 RepID=A0AAW1P549_9CHLO